MRFYGWYETENSVYFAMEYLPYGDLGRYIEWELPECHVRVIGKQLLEGLSVLHSHGWAHRDLKPRNILVVRRAPDWLVKIGDFGVSKHISDDITILNTTVGTPGYTAPEILHFIDADDTEGSSGYTTKVDIWSLGCVLYQLLTGQVPFTTSALAKHCRDKSDFPIALLAEHATPRLTSLIQKMLHKDPRGRFDTDAALHHLQLASNCAERDAGLALAIARDYHPAIKSLISNMFEAYNLAERTRDRTSIVDLVNACFAALPGQENQPGDISLNASRLLHLAATLDKGESLELLRTRLNMDPNFTDLHGYTAFDRALRNSPPDTRAAACLVRHGINIQSSFGVERFPWLICKPLYHAAADGSMALVRTLVSHGAEVNSADNYGLTPLHYASFYLNVDVASYLIQNGAAINSKDAELHTPLHAALGCMYSSPYHEDLWPTFQPQCLAMAELLLWQGANPGLENHRGQSPLDIAVALSNLDLVEIFIERGASIDDNSLGLRSPVLLAIERLSKTSQPDKSREIAKLLINHGARTSVRHDETLNFHSCNTPGLRLRISSASVIPCPDDFHLSPPSQVNLPRTRHPSSPHQLVPPVSTNHDYSDQGPQPSFPVTSEPSQQASPPRPPKPVLDMGYRLGDDSWIMVPNDSQRMRRAPDRLGRPRVEFNVPSPREELDREDRRQAEGERLEAMRRELERPRKRRRAIGEDDFSLWLFNLGIRAADFHDRPCVQHREDRPRAPTVLEYVEELRVMGDLPQIPPRANHENQPVARRTHLV